MNTAIYYFSGTGNSLSIARDIAAKINGVLLSIPAVMDKQSITTEADIIGIVFPCYLPALFGVPLIVERFIKKLKPIRTKYFFSVCTCGGYECVNALPALKKLAALMKSSGGRLSAEYSVRLPMNNLNYDHIPVPINKDHETMFKKSKIKIDDMCSRIIKMKRTKFNIIKSVFNFLMTPMYLMMRSACVSILKEKAKEPKDSNLTYQELIALTDKSISVDEKCNGCATCTKVCPVQNIIMVDDKPVWRHNCEMCFACDEWCPKKAIHHWSRAEGVKYHHPDVKISDLIIKK
jgi:formate hydrogenlyase subunit 6/NADH:ubiquinone oxidoreductase subunit I/flavodoxin